MLLSCLMAMTAAVPIIALVVEWATRTDLSERYHSHHDTFSVSSVVTRTIVLVMVFMGVLGLTTAWLCHLGAFRADPYVVLGFFVPFLLTLFMAHYIIGRYRVTTYSDRLVVRGSFKGSRTVMYRDIEHISWQPLWQGSLVRDLIVHTSTGPDVRLWGMLDINQMLLRIDRFDVLEP